jgi:ribulose-5-phosphate 4-epimerase/fuculose-1-phosphate aldolase
LLEKLEELSNQVATSCRILAGTGLTREPAGHVSARIPDTDLVLIKGRGPDESPVSYTEPQDLIIVDMAGKLVEGRDGLTPPSETAIHTAMYRHRPDVQCTIHMHPPTVVAFTIAQRPLLPVIGAYDPAALSFYFENVPTFPRSYLVNNDEKGDFLAQTIGQGRICMMVGHGITAVGPNVETATLTVIDFNDLAELNYRAALLGTPHPIPDEDLAEFGGRGGGGGAGAARRQEGAPARPAPRGPNSRWRYYEQHVKELRGGGG